MEKDLKYRIRRFKETLDRYRSIHSQLKSTPPQKRGTIQSLNRLLMDAEKDIRHQASRLENSVSGNLWIIRYQINGETFESSFINCTETEAILLTKMISMKYDLEVIETQEIQAHPRPRKL